MTKTFAIGLMVAATAASAGCSTDDNTPASKGPGAALKCTSSGKDAFDTYGAAAFVTVNEAVFTKTLGELSANSTTNLGDSFTKIGTGTPAATKDGIDAFKGKLAAFLVFAYGGPTSITYTDGVEYTGDDQDMVEAHTGLGITDDQYMYFITQIVVPALTDSGVTSDDVSSCFAPVVLDPAFQASITNQ